MASEIFTILRKYVSQLLDDIGYATENVAWPFTSQSLDLRDWIPPEEEDRIAPVRDLENWTGILKEQLPPSEMLSDTQVNRLLDALKKMLDAYNWSFVLQIAVPGRIQYDTIRNHFDQQARIKRWHYGFFELCRSGTEHGKCTLGEYCHCALSAKLFEGFVDEDLTPEEERSRSLEIEVSYLKGKYGCDWMKYYPYHLDARFDDTDTNAYDDDFDEDDGEEWWRK